MAKHIAQFRLPGTGLTFINDWSENILKGPTTSLSIYGLPGTKFKITQNQSSHTFILNNTGLFSVGLDEYPIKELYLNSESYDTITADNSGHVLIIDYIYIDEEAGR